MSIPTLHVGQGAVVDALTVFPVWSSTAPAPRRYLTAKNADLTIAERDGAPVVGELVVTNNSDAPVLLLAGDLLEGGWQHRTVSESILIDAGMAAVVEVTCVERGRWSGGRRHTNRGRKLSPSVRAAVVSIPRPTRQSGVWDRVSSYDRRFTASATESYVDHLDNTTHRSDDRPGRAPPLARSSRCADRHRRLPGVPRTLRQHGSTGRELDSDSEECLP